MFTMKRTCILLLLWAVTLVVADDQSDSVPGTKEPMGPVDNGVLKPGLVAPEVVLQLKYDRGALDRVYLAQFRQSRAEWSPSVPSRTNLCSDLCHAGLGGEGCGPLCKDLTPIGLKSALSADFENHTEEHMQGAPRISVCPTLCANKLGEPLCVCQHSEFKDMISPNWSAVCYAFCQSDNYVLGGCPPCESHTPQQMIDGVSVRGALTSEGWSAWCNVQCRQGQGGAACNCDRPPFL